jgi:N-acetylglucosaminyldiphosphoundecaprenol N-acetyl-beta-D-mannosaminyltransferase
MLQRETEPASDIVDLFGLRIDAIPLDAAVDRLLEWIDQLDQPCRYVVTPNVDHLVLLRHDQALQAAYRHASLVVADGWPLVAVSRWVGRPIPQRVAGSDLVPALLAAAGPRRPLHVFLLGAAPGVAPRAAERIESSWPHVRVSGTYSPPLGFQRDPGENQTILDRIAAAQPDVLVVGLGAPKQELWVHAHHRQLCTRVAICAGATIDFLAGERRRAPRWVQRIGMEWCHRMLGDPRRLVRRYARDAWVFPQLVCREFRRR